MISKEVTYVDFNGMERKETFWFNLTNEEMVAMEYAKDGSLTDKLKNLTKSVDSYAVIEFLKKLVLDSYGVKSPDGRQFIKSEEVKNAFKWSKAYSDIFMELGRDAKAAAAFVEGIMADVKKVGVAYVDDQQMQQAQNGMSIVR